jgi:dTDP-4-dehydrorhamnose 3,5-epimerase
MYTIRELAIAGVFEIIPARISDDRGYFSEVFRTDLLRQHGINAGWVQDNQAFSRRAGVLRGLHYQRPPMAQDKLVRVISGAILDVAVDIRQGSPTFGKWLSLKVSAEMGNQVFVPKGFAHGYRTLEPNTVVLYKVSAFYAPKLEATIRYDDPELDIDWQLSGAVPLLSQRDASASSLHDQASAFSI